MTLLAGSVTSDCSSDEPSCISLSRTIDQSSSGCSFIISWNSTLIRNYKSVSGLGYTFFPYSNIQVVQQLEEAYKVDLPLRVFDSSIHF